MSKEDGLSILVYLGMLAIAIVVGVTVLMNGLPTAFNSKQWAVVLFILIALIVGIIINGIVLELCHLIGYKIGGYKILSFNIFGFCIYKTMVDGKEKFKFKFPVNFDGLTGETIATPEKEKANPMISIIAPLVFFLLEAVAFYIVYIFISTSSTMGVGMAILKYGVIVTATIGLMFALYDYFPAHIDSTTDGYRMTLLTKKVNVIAYNEYLRVVGKEFMGEKDVTVEVFDEITDYTAKLNMLTVYKHLLVEDFKAAEELLDKIIIDPKKISKSAYCEYMSDKIYISFFTKTLEEARNELKNVSSDVKNYIYKPADQDSLKVYVLIEGLIDKSSSEVETCDSKYWKIYKKSTEPNRDKEKVLYSKALAKVLSTGIKANVKEETK
ncbi:MAG: hypothetical protein H6689_03080 [Erysipelotrichaceae bacterium]|nr:hypothetical protein [Erysipelotrichaceae bacterium]MCB9499896.1 hypothetical protein [Erysipelotrichaceae bacterium]